MADLTDLKVLAQKVLDIKESIQTKKNVIEAAKQALKDIQADLGVDDYDRLKAANLALKAILATLDSEVISIDLGSKVLVCEKDSDGGWLTKIAHKL